MYLNIILLLHRKGAPRIDSVGTCWMGYKASQVARPESEEIESGLPRIRVKGLDLLAAPSLCLLAVRVLSLDLVSLPENGLFPMQSPKKWNIYSP